MHYACFIVYTIGGRVSPLNCKRYVGIFENKIMTSEKNCNYLLYTTATIVKLFLEQVDHECAKIQQNIS